VQEGNKKDHDPVISEEALKGFGLLAIMILLQIFMLIPLAGCGNVLYLSRLGWHQGSITFHSVPIQEVLEDEGMNTKMKEKIRLIQEVKRFGGEKLGLRETKNYSKFVEVKGPVLYVVTASEKDCLQLHSWNFPIVGRVTYKGFFTREEALKEERFLKEKGFDTFAQKVGAYSTLGWLKDPIFSSMLEWDDSILANIILHEMTHATVYLKGQTDFNEQIATFIGNRGAIDFLIERYGPASRDVVEAVHLQEDELFFARWIDQACQHLSNFYAQEVPRDEKLKGREEVFRSIKEEFNEIEAQFKTDYNKNFEKVDLNNAVLLAYRRYVWQLEKFETLYEQLGKNIRRFVEYFKTIQASGDKVALSPFLK
jgi:predicted aminopeptidase